MQLNLFATIFIMMVMPGVLGTAALRGRHESVVSHNQTKTFRALSSACSGSNFLLPTEELEIGQAITDEGDPDIHLLLQPDLNLVLYKTDQPYTSNVIWASGTHTSHTYSKAFVRMKKNGNLVIYAWFDRYEGRRTEYWSASTDHKGATLRVNSSNQSFELVEGGESCSPIKVFNKVCKLGCKPTEAPTPAPFLAPPPIPTGQFTPDQADWSAFYSEADASANVADHTPDGALWLTPDAWVPWDGTVVDPTSMSGEQFYNTICPSKDTILGLREVFYQVNPFADPQRPTKAEVDAWHSVALTHLRRLVGIDLPAEPVHCLFARALWAQERKWSTQWDAAYPDGTCGSSSDYFCGHTFLPSAVDQEAYLPEGSPACAGKHQVSTTIVMPSMQVEYPWSIKWANAFCITLKLGDHRHVASFFTYPQFGFSFRDNGNFHTTWGGPSISFLWDT